MLRKSNSPSKVGPCSYIQILQSLIIHKSYAKALNSVPHCYSQIQTLHFFLFSQPNKQNWYDILITWKQKLKSPVFALNVILTLSSPLFKFEPCTAVRRNQLTLLSFNLISFIPECTVIKSGDYETIVMMFLILAVSLTRCGQWAN